MRVGAGPPRGVVGSRGILKDAGTRRIAAPPVLLSHGGAAIADGNLVTVCIVVFVDAVPAAARRCGVLTQENRAAISRVDAAIAVSSNDVVAPGWEDAKGRRRTTITSHPVVIIVSYGITGEFWSCPALNAHAGATIIDFGICEGW